MGNSSMVLLIAVGCVAVGLIPILIGSAMERRRRGNRDYDERQQYVRGKAYQYALMTLMACILVWIGLYGFGGWDWTGNVANVGLCCMCLSALVFTVYCTVHDSYLSWRSKHYAAFGVTVALMGGAYIALWWMSERWLEFWHLAVGLFWLADGAAILLRRWWLRRKKDGEEL